MVEREEEEKKVSINRVRNGNPGLGTKKKAK